MLKYNNITSNFNIYRGETMSGKLEELQLKVARLSRRTHELGIPIMVLFGDSCFGEDTFIK